jgi:hypothetical protein
VNGLRRRSPHNVSSRACFIQVFDTLGLPLLERLLAGVNVCVSVYGHDAHDDGATQGQLTIWCCSVSPPG